MTQRRRTSKAKAKRGFGRRAFLTGAGAAACAAAGWYLRQKSDAEKTAASGQDSPPAPNPALPAGEWRAVWVSYLDWALLDFSTEDTFRAGEGLYLNPAVPAAADYVVQGVAELVQNYPVDGIHFDDYFYPTTDAAVDAVQFAASGAADLATWRRQNVTALVAKVHRTVKAADPTLRFGISPQGNPDNDLDQQYSDVTAWLAAGGEEKVIDYLCPQVYWGYGFTLHSGSTRFAFENIVPAWLSYPRAGDVALYFGLGAYRVGTGDGGTNPDSVSGWSTGSALAAQVKDLRGQAAGGWALYRYGSLFGPEAPALAGAECAALRALNG